MSTECFRYANWSEPTGYCHLTSIIYLSEKSWRTNKGLYRVAPFVKQKYL